MGFVWMKIFTFLPQLISGQHFINIEFIGINCEMICLDLPILLHGLHGDCLQYSDW